VLDLKRPYPGRCCDAPNVVYAGYLGDAALGTCVRPSFVFCATCQAEGLMRCGQSRESVCPGCARQYRGKVAAVVCRGTELVPAGYAVMLTLTAPGNVEHWLPSEEKCLCTPAEGVNLGEWNATLTARWNRFLEAIRRGEASPLVGGRRRAVPLQYVNAKEIQRRGALHTHGVLRRSDGKPLQLVRSQLRALAIAHGFGHSLVLRRVGLSRHGGSKARSSKGVGWYVAKYVSKAADARGRVPWGTVQRWTTRTERLYATTREVKCQETVDAPGRRWRTWTASRGWGCSMRELREEARARAVNGTAAGGGPARGTSTDPPPAPDPCGTPQVTALDSLTGSYAEERAQSPPVSVPGVIVRAFGPCEAWISG
jgi:hypothetical protein